MPETEKKRKRMLKKHKIKHSFATYAQGKGEYPMVCLKELAKEISAVTRIPEKINLMRATEISLLAQHYLVLNKKYERLLKDAMEFAQ